MRKLPSLAWILMGIALSIGLPILGSLVSVTYFDGVGFDATGRFIR